ncbi:hypothetical protein HMPREF3232_00982 [Fannyhessea vaginae]|nr:hypothetical protein HMPREF3232_00982 [Fannyhessea vaginae]
MCDNHMLLRAISRCVIPHVLFYTFCFTVMNSAVHVIRLQYFSAYDHLMYSG